MNIGDLFFSLRAADTQLSRDVEAAAAKAGTKGSASFASTFKKGMGVVAGIAAVAFTGFFIGSIKAAKDWETAFAGVKKTLDVTGLSAEETAEAFGEIEDGLRDMARRIPVPVEELARLAEVAGALGIARDDMLSFVETSALLGTTTDVSAEAAATAIGKINAVIPMTTDQMRTFANVLVDLGNKGASFESEIITLAQGIAGVSAQVGISEVAMLGWASAIANVGEDAEAGSSSFSKFAANVNKLVVEGGSKLEDMAAIAGQTADEFDQAFRKDASGALESLVLGLADLDEKAQIAALALLGITDIRQRRLFLSLIANTDNLASSLDTAGQAAIDNNAATIEAGKRWATLDSKIQQAKNALNEIAITVGEVLLPPVTEMVTMVAGLATGLGEWLEANPELVKTLTPLLAVLSGLIALKFGASLLTSLLPLHGAGMVLSKAWSGLIEPALSSALSGAWGAMGKPGSKVIQAAIATGRGMGLAAAASMAAAFVVIPLLVAGDEGPMEDTEFRILQIGRALEHLGTLDPTAKWGLGTVADAIAILNAQVDALKQGNVALADSIGKNGIPAIGALDDAARTASENISDLDWGVADMPDRVREAGAEAGTALGASLVDAYMAQLAVLARTQDVALEGQWDLAVAFAKGNAEAIKAQWSTLPDIMQDAALSVGVVTAEWIAANERLTRSNTSLSGGMTIGMAEARQVFDRNAPGMVASFGSILLAAQQAGAQFGPAFTEPTKAAVAQAAAELARMAPSFKSTILGARGSVQAAMLELKYAILHPMARVKEVAFLEGRLTGERLAQALRSKNPDVRAEGERVRAILIAEWEKLTGQTWNYGLSTSANLAKGILRNKPQVTGAAGTVADSVARPILTLKDKMLAYGANTIAEYIAGINSKRQAAIEAGAGIVKAVGPVFKAHSPPTHPLNPMRDIRKWGRATAMEYGYGFRDAGGDLKRMAGGAMSGLAGLGLSPMSLSASVSGALGTVDVGPAVVRHEHTITAEGARALKAAGFDDQGVAAALAGAGRSSRSVYTDVDR